MSEAAVASEGAGICETCLYPTTTTNGQPRHIDEKSATAVNGKHEPHALQVNISQDGRRLHLNPLLLYNDLDMCVLDQQAKGLNPSQANDVCMQLSNGVSMNSSNGALDGFSANYAEMTKDDRFLKIPITATSEGVHNGAFKSADELRKSVIFFENKPICLLHPPGRGITGLNEVHGLVRNVRVDGANAAWKGEAWFFRNADELRNMGHTDESIRAHEAFVGALEAGGKFDGSIGYWHNTIQEDGEYGGMRYNRREVNILPDHFAVVDRGASPWEKGTGFGQMSHDPKQDVGRNEMKNEPEKFEQLVKNIQEKMQTAQNVDEEITELKQVVANAEPAVRVHMKSEINQAIGLDVFEWVEDNGATEATGDPEWKKKQEPAENAPIVEGPSDMADGVPGNQPDCAICDSSGCKYCSNAEWPPEEPATDPFAHEDIEDGAIEDLGDLVEQLHEAIDMGDLLKAKDIADSMDHHVDDLEEVQDEEERMEESYEGEESEESGGPDNLETQNLSKDFCFKCGGPFLNGRCDKCGSSKKLPPGFFLPGRHALNAEATAKIPVNFLGLDLVIENPKGSMRRGIDGNGTPWATLMAADYGSIRGTTGNDGDEVDFYLGEDLGSAMVYIIEQLDSNGQLDEQKVMLGFPDEEAAVNAYKAHFPTDRHDRIGQVVGLNIKDFVRTVSPMKVMTNKQRQRIRTNALLDFIDFKLEVCPECNHESALWDANQERYVCSAMNCKWRINRQSFADNHTKRFGGKCNNPDCGSYKQKHPNCKCQDRPLTRVWKKVKAKLGRNDEDDMCTVCTNCMSGNTDEEDVRVLTAPPVPIQMPVDPASMEARESPEMENLEVEAALAAGYLPKAASTVETPMSADPHPPVIDPDAKGSKEPLDPEAHDVECPAQVGSACTCKLALNWDVEMATYGKSKD